MIGEGQEDLDISEKWILEPEPNPIFGWKHRVGNFFHQYRTGRGNGNRQKPSLKTPVVYAVVNKSRLEQTYAIALPVLII